jgi:hypothetical protein
LRGIAGDEGLGPERASPATDRQKSGIRVERLRLYCLVLVTVVASSCLAFTGVIGSSG